MDSSSLAHCKWECQYYVVFIPKFRRKKLYGTVKDDVRDIIKTLCSYKKVEIIPYYMILSKVESLRSPILRAFCR